MSNTMIATVVVFILVPLLKKGHKNAHETTKKNMKPGWLKTLLTYEIGKRHPSKS